MSKADEMFEAEGFKMDIVEKDIEYIKYGIEELKGSYELHNQTWANNLLEEMSISVKNVLNYIENSIPKKKVEEKIEETKLNKNHKYTAGTVVAIMNELQELLEVE